MIMPTASQKSPETSMWYVIVVRSISGCQDLAVGRKYEDKGITERVFWVYGTYLYSDFHDIIHLLKCLELYKKSIIYHMLV